ncbi:MAG: hypothetical protein A2135_00140 [Actinobacteria bacterium RBG_16_67_15]|nr:MAG: hypothetical protein A2135_00140 [Actinobacteria bacterium RBG_16_67_15]
MKRTTMVLVLVGMVLLLAACSAGVNPDVGTAPAVVDHPAGFWLGLWHGFITPVTFVISLFKDSVNVYEVHNSGNWYDFGFVFGLSMIFGGSHGARHKR